MNEEYENVDDEDNLLEEEDSRNSKFKKKKKIISSYLAYRFILRQINLNNFTKLFRGWIPRSILLVITT